MSSILQLAVYPFVPLFAVVAYLRYIYTLYIYVYIFIYLKASLTAYNHNRWRRHGIWFAGLGYNPGQRHRNAIIGQGCTESEEEGQAEWEARGNVMETG